MMNEPNRLANAEAYSCPVAFLPARSVLPLAASWAKPGREADQPWGAALPQVSDAARALAQRWQQAIVISHWLACDLAELDGTLATVALTLPVNHTALRQQASNGQPLDPEQVAQSDMSAVMAQACAIYDRYFQVTRVHPMRFDLFVAQVTETTRQLLPDLPYTLLDRTQITHLLCAVGAMFSALHAKLADHSQATLPTQGAPAGHSSTGSPYHAAWQQAEANRAAWTAQVAHYRWQVGHHFYDLGAIFCANALRTASDALGATPPNAGCIATAVAHLQQAAIFLRGMTAAMWYAGDFPVQTYQQIIRPSMVMPGGSGGFSGDQNADYNRMKQAKQQLKAQLRAMYGEQLATMPAPLRNAFFSFHEADIEDNEHHLLIAAHKVGIDQSLAQKEWQAELPDLAYKQTALDVLREMAEQKRREFAN